MPSVKMAQIRWASRSRSRSKERRVWRKDNQEAQGQDGVDHQALQGESRLRRDSTTDYAADNSSEHSSTATPLTQSPRHRLLNVQHGKAGDTLSSHHVSSRDVNACSWDVRGNLTFNP